MSRTFPADLRIRFNIFSSFLCLRLLSATSCSRSVCKRRAAVRKPCTASARWPEDSRTSSLSVFLKMDLPRSAEIAIAEVRVPRVEPIRCGSMRRAMRKSVAYFNTFVTTLC